MSSKKITDLNQMKLAALRGKADTASKVAELAQVVSDAVDDIEKTKQENPPLRAITLSAAGWVDKSQTVQNEIFLPDGYFYLVKADGASVEAYAAAGVTPQDVTVEGQMTFTAKTTPTGDLTLSVIRFMEG